MTDATDYPTYIDRRDAPVVNQLTSGEVYDVRTLARLYKRHTDIRRDTTAKDRKRALCESPCMENVAIGKFRYTGVDVDE